MYCHQSISWILMDFGDSSGNSQLSTWDPSWGPGASPIQRALGCPGGGWLGPLEKWLASKYYQWFNGVLCDCNVIFNVFLIGFNLVICS